MRGDALDPRAQTGWGIELAQHGVEGNGVRRVGLRAGVLDEREGADVRGREVAEQVVAPVEQALEEALPAREPPQEGGVLVTRGDGVRRSLPDIVEPLDEDVNLGAGARLARIQRRLRLHGLQPLDDPHRVG